MIPKVSLVMIVFMLGYYTNMWITMVIWVLVTWYWVETLSDILGNPVNLTAILRVNLLVPQWQDSTAETQLILSGW